MDGRYRYAVNVPLTDGLDEPPDDRDEVIAELRAILQPLLYTPIPSPIVRCVFCQRRILVADPWGDPYDAAYHAPDCPVLRKDELLGRV